MRVDIWSDLVCPWCYVGWSRLRRALAGFAHQDELTVRWHSFELNPGLARGRSEPLTGALARRLRDLPAGEITRRQARVAAAIRDEGLPYQAERRHGSTFDLHRLLHLAADAGRATPTLDAIHQAHFGSGLDVFDPAVAAGVVTAAGLDATEVRRVLAGDAYAERVFTDERAAHDLRITGVPFVLIDRTLAVPGARGSDVFTRALDTAWARRPRIRAQTQARVQVQVRARAGRGGGARIRQPVP
ncbi:DsbA family oxidoreductase [Frankia sp. R82]|uniref:DsbA family oxidoreductase n=1 Tax=Frankia sp. R82 TaxID=2950553 RepID=UPI002043C864|nr:DsbA family oxidoreductase [Frankia sp. R82]MCM3887170.1 DsbA family oxidoreductase [Frankia sp. R82]